MAATSSSHLPRGGDNGDGIAAVPCCCGGGWAFVSMGLAFSLTGSAGKSSFRITGWLLCLDRAGAAAASSSLAPPPFLSAKPPPPPPHHDRGHGRSPRDPSRASGRHR